MVRLTEFQQNALSLAVAGICLGSVLGLFIFGPFHIGVLDYQLVTTEYPDGLSLYGVTSETALVAAHEEAIVAEGYAITATRSNSGGISLNETKQSWLSEERDTYLSTVETANSTRAIYVDESLMYTRETDVDLNETTPGYEESSRTLYSTRLIGQQKAVSTVQSTAGVHSDILYAALGAGKFEPRQVTRENGVVVFTYELVAIDRTALETPFQHVTDSDGRLVVDEFGVIRGLTMTVGGQAGRGTSTAELTYNIGEPTSPQTPDWTDEAVEVAPPVSDGKLDLLVTSQPSNTLSFYNIGTKMLPAGTEVQVDLGDLDLYGTLSSSLTPSEPAYFIPTQNRGLVETDGPQGDEQLSSLNVTDNAIKVTYKNLTLATTQVRSAETIQTTIDYQWTASPYGRTLELTVLSGDTVPAGAQVLVDGDGGQVLAGTLPEQVGPGEQVYIKPDYIFPTLEISSTQLSPRSQEGGVKFPEEATLTITAFGEAYVDEYISHTGSSGLADPLSAKLHIGEQWTTTGVIYTLTVKKTTADSVRVHYARSAESPTLNTTLSAGETLSIPEGSDETTAIIELVRDDTPYLVGEVEPFGGIELTGGYSVTVTPSGVEERHDV
jgi:hypothetical protein